MAIYFADSYALIEMLKGNSGYLPFSGEQLLTTEFNVCEVAFAVCRDYPRTANATIAFLRSVVTVVETDDEDYCSGAFFRRETTGNGLKLSMIDCIGYSVAKRLRVPFLTGDREFKDLEDVKFVR